MIKLAITSGDRDGIGLEVACKALSTLGPQRTARFVLTAHDSPNSKTFLRTLGRFHLVEISSREVSFSAALAVLEDLRPNEILVYLDTGRDRSIEASWVAEAARASLEGSLNGLITGPVSKERFRALGRKFMGHTGLLSQISGRDVYQGYIGKKLNVVLASDHISLNEVTSFLKPQRMRGAIEAAHELRALLPSEKSKLPFTLLGLDPHAGESGLIGRFDSKWRKTKGVVGPVSADSAFSPDTRKATSVYVALYHDQGLIPFKMLHGQDSGFQISLGLPFVRTSVDHGTAKDIFGKNKANPGSMTDAIRAAIRAASLRNEQGAR